MELIRIEDLSVQKLKGISEYEKGSLSKNVLEFKSQSIRGAFLDKCT